MPCKILISTTVAWTSTARHAAGFARAGCSVAAVAPEGAPVHASRYVSASHTYSPIFASSSLRTAIATAQPDLIVSCDDRAVANLRRLYAREATDSAVAKVIERSLGEPAQYARIMARETAIRIARGLGIRTPETLPIMTEQALDDCLRIVGLPAVLKADGSWGGEGVIVAKTREEAHQAWLKLANAPSRLRSAARAWKRHDAHCLMDAIAPKRRAVSIQKFIPGRPAASAFAAWNGEVVGAIYYDMLKTDGDIGPPSVIRRVDCPEIAEATRLIARHFSLTGLHGIDFIRDNAGHVHLLEINPRATQGGTLAYGPGRDLAAALASCLMPSAKPRPAIANDTVVFFPGEWSLNPDSQYLKIGHHDVPWDDPIILRACLENMSRPAKASIAAVAHREMPFAANSNIPSAAIAARN
ncbi:MAG TPA: hypothetical protein VGG69_10810 [Rhizomicrobium sp.]